MAGAVTTSALGVGFVIDPGGPRHFVRKQIDRFYVCEVALPHGRHIYWAEIIAECKTRAMAGAVLMSLGAASERLGEIQRLLHRVNNDREVYDKSEIDLARELSNVIVMHERWREEGLELNRRLSAALDRERRFRGWRTAIFANLNGARINPRSEIKSRERAIEYRDYHRARGIKAKVMRGDKFTLATLPFPFISAIKRNQRFLFDRDLIFHGKSSS